MTLRASLRRVLRLAACTLKDNTQIPVVIRVALGSIGQAVLGWQCWVGSVLQAVDLILLPIFVWSLSVCMPPEVIRVALGSVALKPSAGARLLSRTALGVHAHESTQTSGRKERLQETLDAYI